MNDTKDVSFSDFSPQQQEEFVNSLVKAVGVPRMIKLTLEQRAKMAELLK